MRGAAEEQVGSAAAGAGAMGEQVATQHRRDRRVAGPLVGLRCDLALFLVPAAADVDEVGAQVDVVVAEPAQFAAAQPGVEGGRPEGLIVLVERVEQLCGLGRGRGTAAGCARVGQLQAVGRVDRYLATMAAVQGPPESEEDL